MDEKVYIIGQEIAINPYESLEGQLARYNLKFDFNSISMLNDKPLTNRFTVRRLRGLQEDKTVRFLVGIRVRPILIEGTLEFPRLDEILAEIGKDLKGARLYSIPII